MKNLIISRLLLAQGSKLILRDSESLLNFIQRVIVLDKSLETNFSGSAMQM